MAARQVARALLLGAFVALALDAASQDRDADGVLDPLDNCPDASNGASGDDQRDSDGDGIGNACECGDASGDGFLSTVDASLIQRCVVGLLPCPKLCDVTGDGECKTIDASLLQRFVVGALTKRDLTCAERPRPEFTGQTAFVSADPASSEADPSVGDILLLAGPTDNADREQSVEEGDIYRVLGDRKILNLNRYRGLQVIEFRDVANPRILGRLAVSASPVELYVVGERAIVLLNQWRGYYGSPEGVRVETREGGLVLSVDLSDPAHPVEVNRANVPGLIQTSRLVRDGAQAALYVAASSWGPWPQLDGSLLWESRTTVQSFEVSGGRLERRQEIHLGGSVIDIQATPEALLVARRGATSRSLVSVIDIDDPAGRMILGDEVEVAGRVESQFNLDLYKGVLRVVSEAPWPQRINVLETFDASDFRKLKPIDRDTFGANEQLYATLFLGNKAFFVTYLRVDPFHAVFIDDAGIAEPRSEFIVSGWNDFFRAALGNTRLLGVGVNDEAGSTLALSLYDITDLRNPSPLLARAEVAADASWSEARWDHRAFSVLENAVDVAGPEGVRETGLVLLPFSGFSEDRKAYTAAVQIFTFSARSLTRRGVMVHGTPVRRSFLADPETTANLSEAQLSLFDATDPDAPTELGRLDLAPNYTRVFLFGDYVARVKDTETSYAPWWGERAPLPPAVVEILPPSEHPDSGQFVARFEIPEGSGIYQVGSLLVAARTRAADTSAWPYTYSTEIEVYDLSDPTTPVFAGGLTTDRLHPSYPYLPWSVTLDWPISAPGRDEALPVDNGLVFLQRRDERAFVGKEEVCWTWPAETSACWSPELQGWKPGCTYHAGSVTCRSLNGSEPRCSGTVSRCTVDEAGNSACEPVEPGSLETRQSCTTYDRYRYWQSFGLEVLNLATPTNPRLADPIDLPREDEGVGILAERSGVWVSFKRPHEVVGDPRPYAKHFVRHVDLSDPGAPRLGEAINVPGELVAIEGGSLFTHDWAWGEEGVESAVARSELAEGVAVLRARRAFPKRMADRVLLDGAGHVLVSHRELVICLYDAVPSRWGGAAFVNACDDHARTSVLDLLELGTLAEIELESFAQLRAALAGRALFSVLGGLLVFNLEDPTQPYPQAFFAMQGYPLQILGDEDRLIIPAARNGIYVFDLDEFHLRPPSELAGGR